ncbi:MAG: SH3 domain-containing protein [Chloroflexi bacterium]|nr:SH3 domain-containing protein [Chloroflexota bacterium]
MTTEVERQRADTLWAGASPPAPTRSRRQRNAESLARVLLCTVVFGGVAWFLGGWQWGVPVGLLAFAATVKLRADARAAWRRQAATDASARAVARRTWRRGDQLALAHSADLRARPDLAGQPFSALATGVAVTVLAVQDDWIFVQSDDGTEGWTRL